MSTRKITDTRHKQNQTEYFKISIFSENCFVGAQNFSKILSGWGQYWNERLNVLSARYHNRSQMLRKGLQTTLSFWDKFKPEFLFEEAALFFDKNHFFKLRM